MSADVAAQDVCAWIDEHVEGVRLTPWQRRLLRRWFGPRKPNGGGESLMSRQRASEVTRAAAAAVWGARLELIEVVFLAAFVVGVWLIYMPAGWMMTGVLGVLWCERAAPRAKVTATRPRAVGERAA
ncbi:hypothetical protein [Actinoallomurus iriomotensis]|uniref:Uncharacterized protein n=1 Tax=Actinoallomurus iriomotensis TaxID=478107 RepID=A0A9W6VWR1_9ACTN|nr:hypothetical protein [Actinoallomurus iriomotensis]GLY81847.1 hypothetical protein Airi01_101140 [Actinoallomurus iriomotensis]